MGLYEDISTLIDVGYDTKHILDDGTEVPIQLATGPVASLSSVRDLLPVALDIDDPDIAIVDGSSISCYGVDSEFTFVLLIYNGPTDIWVHCFKYQDATGYELGVALQTPAAEIRA